MLNQVCKIIYTFTINVKILTLLFCKIDVLSLSFSLHFSTNFQFISSFYHRNWIDLQLTRCIQSLTH